MNQNTTYNQITARMIISILLITLLVSFIYSEYLKKEVIVNLAKADAKQTSQLVFESMYSSMQKGWNKDEIQETIDRLNKVNKDLKIFVYRGSLVAEIYGDIENDKKARQSAGNIKNAFEGEERIDVIDNEIIKYYFPIIANDKCQKCHINSKNGDVLGVININYPITDLKVSLNDIVNMFLIFIVCFSGIIFLVFFINFNRYLLKPIENFIKTTDAIKKSNDITQRVKVNKGIQEIKSMQIMFNDMLDSIEHQFYFDPLTNLKNRRALREDLEKHNDILFMIINIDKFQQINSLYGEDIGNKILVELKDKFLELLPKSARLYKLHADEFGVISKNTMDIKEFENIASYITSHLGKYQFEVKNKEKIYINLTIGISHGSTLLLPNADMALKLAKKSKKDFLTYNEDMRTLREYENRITWTKRLINAIDEDKIVPLFQPIFDCKTNEIIKYEALMRIKENEDDYVVPVHFLDISKENKIYSKLTLIILKKVFETCIRTGKNFAINLTIEDMTNDEIVNYILQEFQNKSFAQNITFEILESEGIENYEEVKDFIDKVKKYDVTISIDDFGTGYSNFEYLMNLNVDYLKIDASMIKNIDKDEKSQLVTKTIVEFAKKIELKTVAEFVSNDKVYDKIKEYGIDYAQGYYLGEPISL